MAAGRWSRFSPGTVILMIVLAFFACQHRAYCATYGEPCDAGDPCVDATLVCSGNCVCAAGYDHIYNEDVCRASVEFVNPDFHFKTSTTFRTDLNPQDLDRTRRESIQRQMEEQLSELFRKVVGFTSVTILTIKISDNILTVEWMVIIDADSPEFSGITREEAVVLIIKDLEPVSQAYRNITISTDATRPTESDKEPDILLAIGLGIGLAAAFIVVCVIVCVALYFRRKKAAGGSLEQKSTGGGSSGASTQLDGENYQYSVYMKDGFSIPPHYSTPTEAPSESSATTYAEIDDKRPLHKI